MLQTRKLSGGLFFVDIDKYPEKFKNVIILQLLQHYLLKVSSLDIPAHLTIVNCVGSSLSVIDKYYEIQKNMKNIAHLALVPPQSTLTHILRNSKLFQYYKYHNKNWVSRSVNCIVASTCRHWQIFFPASVLNTLLWRHMQDIIWNMGGHILELSRQNAAVLYFSVNWDVKLRQSIQISKYQQ